MSQLVHDLAGWYRRLGVRPDGEWSDFAAQRLVRHLKVTAVEAYVLRQQK